MRSRRHHQHVGSRLAGLFTFFITVDGDSVKAKCCELVRMDTGKVCEAEPTVAAWCTRRLARQGRVGRGAGRGQRRL